VTIELVEAVAPAEPVSAVSWAAIAGGAVVAVATTLILLTLGSSMGLATASPWARAAETAGRIGILAGIWLVVVQWLSSGVGGYIAGRLRTRWIGLHSHEAHFRDTAHGFMTWAAATVIMAAIAASASAGLTGAAAAVASTTGAPPNLAYDADTLYRSPGGDAAALAPARAEAERMLAAGAVSGGLSADDRAYLIASISSRAAVTPDEAGRRVDLVIAREHKQADDAKAAADKAREAAAGMAVLTALSMLVGAFIASVAAALGGQQRDLHP
jgi:hypothetical protein